MSSPSRLILGFDASCGRCAEIAKAAKRAAGEKLEVLPLGHQEVREFRTQALGEDAAWVPTLIRVEGDRVQAWTGLAMGAQLFVRLGMRAAIRLCAALGDLARANRAAKRGEEPAARYGEESLARRRFLRISAGAGIAIGIVLTGKAPALADEAGRAEAWVAANRNRLPKTYERFSTYNITYRRAIYRELDPKARQQLWADHIANYRMTHANLTNEQNAALAKVDARVAQLNTFTTRVREKADPEDERLLQDLTQAFGQDEAIALVAVLGPADKPSPEAANSSNSGVLVTCECSTQYDLCYWPSQSNKVCSQLPSCSVTWDGCGLFYQYGCNGMCVSGCGC